MDLNYEIVRLYAGKAIGGIADKFVKESREHLLESRAGAGDTTLTTNTNPSLQVVLSGVKGRKSFNEKAALEVMRENISEEEFVRRCTTLQIKPRAGVEIPDEFVKQMQKYLIVTRVEAVSEDVVKAAGLPENVLEGCYTRGAPSVRLNTPTSVTNSEISDLCEEYEGLVPLASALDTLEVV